MTEETLPDPDNNAGANANSNAEASPERQRLRFALPPWLDHFNAHDLKVVFRCWAAVWVSTLLMFIGPALDSIGIATFFGALLLYIVPPGNILFIYLLATLSLLLGMCLAWAWGLVTMKAALAARPDSQTQTQLLRLKEQAAVQAQQSGESITWTAQKLIHDGFMFDTRVTVIYYVMSCLFVYVMARLRAANRKFALTEMFGIIVMDLFLLIGPSLPSWTGELGKVLVEPGAVGIGLGFVCSLLFFPQSTSYAVLGQMENLIRMGQTSLQHTRDSLAGQPTELAQMQSVKARTIRVFKDMQPMLAFLALDFSCGRWGADDVRSLQIPVRQAMAAQIALLDFHIARREAEEKLEEFESHLEGHHGSTATEKPLHTIGHWQLRESADMMHALKAPELGVIRSRTVEALRQGSKMVHWMLWQP